jgi:hypothetical protein
VSESNFLPIFFSVLSKIEQNDNINQSNFSGESQQREKVALSFFSHNEIYITIIIFYSDRYRSKNIILNIVLFAFYSRLYIYRKMMIECPSPIIFQDQISL